MGSGKIIINPFSHKNASSGITPFYQLIWDLKFAKRNVWLTKIKGGYRNLTAPYDAALCFN
jgi:hypothetical protein